MVERVGEGVEVLRVRSPGRLQRTTNIYLLEADGGLTVYETGSIGAATAIRDAAVARGGIRQIVLSHAHADHRGGAARLDAPIFCHPQERPGAEGDGGPPWTSGASRPCRCETPSSVPAAACPP